MFRSHRDLRRRLVLAGLAPLRLDHAVVLGLLPQRTGEGDEGIVVVVQIIPGAEFPGVIGVVVGQGIFVEQIAQTGHDLVNLGWGRATGDEDEVIVRHHEELAVEALGEQFETVGSNAHVVHAPVMRAQPRQVDMDRDAIFRVPRQSLRKVQQPDFLVCPRLH